MHHLHLELALRNMLCSCHRTIRVTELVAEFTHIVGMTALLRTRRVNELVMDRNHVGRYGIIHARSRWQYFVLNTNSAQCLLRCVAVYRCHGRNGMSSVEGLVGCQDVVARPLQVRRALAKIDHLRLWRRQISVSNNRVHPRHGFRLGHIQLRDARVGMRRAQNCAPDHPRQLDVSTVNRLARHLVNAIMADRTRADYLVLLLRFKCSDHGKPLVCSDRFSRSDTMRFR